jgi:hypothetical protein
MIDGSVEVDGLRSRVNVATIAGDVVVRKSAGFSATATTIDGDIVFSLVADENADFYANTNRGTIESDLPIVLDGWSSPPGARSSRRSGWFRPTGLPGGRGGPPQIVRATIGAGGAKLLATTINGDIRVRRR